MTFWIAFFGSIGNHSQQRLTMSNHGYHLPKKLSKAPTAKKSSKMNQIPKQCFFLLRKEECKIVFPPFCIIFLPFKKEGTHLETRANFFGELLELNFYILFFLSNFELVWPKMCPNGEHRYSNGCQGNHINVTSDDGILFLSFCHSLQI